MTTLPYDLRPACSSDLPGIAALMAPEIARGNLLPRAIGAEDFLVADEDGRLLGAVALTPWSDEVVELGSLVAGPRGRGLGRALVAGALHEAAGRGYPTVVALTSIPAFFQGQGFEVVRGTPWAIALGCATLPVSGALEAALRWKSERCAACARLTGCQQVLLAREVGAAARACA